MEVRTEFRIDSWWGGMGSPCTCLQAVAATCCSLQLIIVPDLSIRLALWLSSSNHPAICSACSGGGGDRYGGGGGGGYRDDRGGDRGGGYRGSRWEKLVQGSTSGDWGW